MEFKEFFEDLDEIINGGMFGNLGEPSKVFLDENGEEEKTHRISDNNDSPNSSTYE
jgi:hypothetical protein